MRQIRILALIMMVVGFMPSIIGRRLSVSRPASRVKQGAETRLSKKSFLSSIRNGWRRRGPRTWTS